MNDGKRTLRWIAFLSVLVLFLQVSHAAAVSEYRITTISDPDLDAVSAVLAGDIIIYTGVYGTTIHENSTRVVQLYSLSTGEQSRLATSDPGSSITSVDISGDYAVWFSEPDIDSPQDTPNQIFLYSLVEKNLTVIRTLPGAEWPKVSGETVIWSENSGDSFSSSIILYDIRSGKMAPVPNISTIDSAGVAFNGRYILYSAEDAGDLLLYTRETGAISTVFSPVTDNNTHEMVFGSALAGDYILYRKDVMVEKPRERYSELCLYTISTGKTVLLSPLTGMVTGTLTESDKNAFFNIGAADTARVVWYVAESVGSDRIMVLNPSTMSVSSVSPKNSVYSLSIDGRNMAWKGSVILFGKGVIYLATVSGGDDGPATLASAPLPTKSGLSPVISLAGFGICGIFVLLRKKE